MSHINKELQKLAKINEDACSFYDEAQEKAESPQLRMTFKNLESLHKGVAVNIKKYIRMNGGDVELEETFTGELREFWGKLMASISNDADETLVKHLEEAEDRCILQMRKIINDDETQAETKQILLTEYEALQKSHDYMKALKECMKAA